MSNEDRTNTPSHSENLGSLREQIDALDQQLLQILASRCALAQRAIEIKEIDSAPVRYEQRERELLKQRVRDGRAAGLDPNYVTRIFHEVIAEAVRIQQDFLQRSVNRELPTHRALKIACNGIDGAASNLVGWAHVIPVGPQAPAPQFAGFSSFREALGAVENGSCDFGILPIENTSSGAIAEVYDLLLNSRVSIVGEQKVKTDHCLVGVSNTPVTHLRRILCTPQARTECADFLAKVPECRIEYSSDAALAAKKIQEGGDPLLAAIASRDVADLFGLTVLQTNIAQQQEHFTRYILIAPQPIKVDPRIPAKTSIMMHTLSHAGALFDALANFKECGINLTRLESRPIAGNNWEEMFYLDFLGNLEAPHVRAALDNLTRTVRFIKILGCYPSCDVIPTKVELSDSAPADEQLTREQPVVPAPPKSAGKDKGYKLVTREHKSNDTIIDVNGVQLGGGNFVVIAGPCSVESREQIMACAREARDRGALILRGGVFKPRSSPYSFQGLGYQGLELLREAGRTFGLPMITEVMTTEDVERVAEQADIIQIGARNMQNFSLLKSVGQIRRPVMLKRGMSSSIEELLQAAEYILAGGNQQVFLCERGIRTFETATRGTLDISAVPVLKARTHLPVFIDPSHAAGVRELVPPLALAAKAVGADGIIVEFHPNPEQALSDGPQALRFGQFEKLMRDLEKLRP